MRRALPGLDILAEDPHDARRLWCLCLDERGSRHQETRREKTDSCVFHYFPSLRRSSGIYLWRLGACKYIRDPSVHILILGAFAENCEMARAFQNYRYKRSVVNEPRS